MAYAAWSVIAGEQPTAAKWNILGTNDASFNDGTGIGTSAITPEKLLAGAGTSWTWTTWTPAWTNPATIGNAVVTAKYAQIGKTVHCRVRVVGGSTTSGTTSGAPMAGTLPITASSDYTIGATNDQIPAGVARLVDTGVAIYAGYVRVPTTTTFDIVAYLASGTNATEVGIPYAFASGDILTCSFTYDAP